MRPASERDGREKRSRARRVKNDLNKLAYFSRRAEAQVEAAAAQSYNVINWFINYKNA